MLLHKHAVLLIMKHIDLALVKIKENNNHVLALDEYKKLADEMDEFIEHLNNTLVHIQNDENLLRKIEGRLDDLGLQQEKPHGLHSFDQWVANNISALRQIFKRYIHFAYQSPDPNFNGLHAQLQGASKLLHEFSSVSHNTAKLMNDEYDNLKDELKWLKQESGKLHHMQANIKSWMV